MPSWSTRLNSHVYLQISTSENTNAGGNYSTVNYSLDLICDSGSAYNGYNNYWYVSIAGTTWADGYASYSLSNGQSKNLASGTTGALYHDANGALTINVTGYYDENANSCGGSWTLTDFDRRPGVPSFNSITRTVRSMAIVLNAVSSPAGTATYYVDYSQNGGGWTGQQSSTGTSFTFSGLSDGSSYIFRTYASNSDGTSGTYSSGSYSIPTVPGAPSSITVPTPSGRAVTITAGAASDGGAPPVAYYSQLSADNGTTWKNAAGTTNGSDLMTSQQYTYSNLTGGATYKFRVYATNEMGSSSYTTSASTFVASGGKRFDGTAWQATGTAKRFDGTTWQLIGTAKRFDGTTWQPLS